ncbi:hypothetical protein T01_15388 [Trichinella spiralis]|uniref:Uncharacterized protein n=1 Tax=Trichinella spiralis TaxID=6334 RepID=A0A0V1B599_TRISP|nr:hypothetical protein T01_15388 [Trichinella spiralis]
MFDRPAAADDRFVHLVETVRDRRGGGRFGWLDVGQSTRCDRRGIAVIRRQFVDERFVRIGSVVSNRTLQRRFHNVRMADGSFVVGDQVVGRPAVDWSSSSNVRLARLAVGRGRRRRRRRWRPTVDWEWEFGMKMTVGRLGRTAGVHGKYRGRTEAFRFGNQRDSRRRSSTESSRTGRRRVVDSTRLKDRRRRRHGRVVDQSLFGRRKLVETVDQIPDHANCRQRVDGGRGRLRLAERVYRQFGVVAARTARPLTLLSLGGRQAAESTRRKRLPPVRLRPAFRIGNCGRFVSRRRSTAATVAMVTVLVITIDASRLLVGAGLSFVVQLRGDLRLEEKLIRFTSGGCRRNHERVSETNAGDLLVRQAEPDRHGKRRRSAHVRLNHHHFLGCLKLQFTKTTTTLIIIIIVVVRQRTTTTSIVTTTQPLRSSRARVAVATAKVGKYLHNTSPRDETPLQLLLLSLTSPPVGQAARLSSFRTKQFTQSPDQPVRLFCSSFACTDKT